MSQEVQTYWIPEFMENWVREQLNKLNNRAMKLDCMPINFHKTDKVEYRKIFVGDPEDIWYEPGEHNYKNYKFIEITLCGEAPKLRGWKFVGVIQHMEVNGEPTNILRLLEGETVPEEFRYTENKCDHCMFIRNRNDTYLVRKDETILQVGSSCLKDFTGHKNPHAIAQIAEDFLDFLRNLEGLPGFSDEFTNFSDKNPHYQIEDFLSFVCASINKHGFVSRRMINSGEAIGQTTAENAWYYMTVKSQERQEALQWLKTSDNTLIANALSWIRAEAVVDGSNDYMWNLYVACSQDYISRRESGLVASLITAYQRHIEYIEKQKREHAGNIGGYVGEIGKRINLGTLVLSNVIVTEGTFGTTYIHKLYDSTGNVIVWMTGKDLRDELEDGWKLENVVATVKTHEEFRGEKQTKVTRMKWTN